MRVNTLMKNIQCLLKHLGYILGLGAIPIFILASSAVAGQSESIAGCYYDFVITGSVGDNKPRPAFSTLELTPIGKDQYKFSLTVVGGNFHTCGGEGIVIVKKRGKNPVLEMLRDEQEEAERGLEPCQVRIRFTRDKVMIEGNNGECREYFGCGMRVDYTDANFLRKNKRPKCADEP